MICSPLVFRDEIDAHEQDGAEEVKENMTRTIRTDTPDQISATSVTKAIKTSHVIMTDS